MSVTSKWKKFIEPALFLILLTACYAYAVSVRLDQVKVWEQNPTAYFVGEIPMMTTHDAHSWIQKAKDHSTTRPMLSWMIGTFSSVLNQDIHITAFYMVPWLAGLFIFPLGFYFRKAGLPHAGLLGGIIGALSPEYMIRSAMGRVDTDCLNLFFPVLISLCLLLAKDTNRNRLLFSALAGISCFIFDWWYAHPLFTMLYFGTLGLCLILNRTSPKIIIACLLLFGIFAHPAVLADGMSDFLTKISAYGNVSKPLENKVEQGFVLPNIYMTISETQRYSIKQNLSLILTDYNFAGIGLVLLLGLCISHFRSVIPLAPLLFTGLFAFQSGRRFVMFLSPFAGLGYGWLFWIVIQWIKPKKIPVKMKKGKSPIAPSEPLDYWWKPLIPYGISVLFFASIQSKTAIGFVPSPSVPPEIFSAVTHVKKIIPEKSWVWNFWDYGYFLEDVGNFRIYHHGGGSQFSPVTYFAAKAYASANPKEMYSILSFVHNNLGQMDFYNMSSLPDLLPHLQTNRSSLKEDVYLLYTSNLIRIFAMIRMIGLWDLKTGEHDPSGFRNYSCQSYNPQSEILSCSDGEGNLKEGTAPGNITIDKVIFVKNGKPVHLKNFERPGSPTLQILLTDQGITHVLLLREDLFQSNFNQMYLLGRYDPAYFEELYVDFPAVRLFRIKSGAPF